MVLLGNIMKTIMTTLSPTVKRRSAHARDHKRYRRESISKGKWSGRVPMRVIGSTTWDTFMPFLLVSFFLLRYSLLFSSNITATFSLIVPLEARSDTEKRQGQAEATLFCCCYFFHGVFCAPWRTNLGGKCFWHHVACFKMFIDVRGRINTLASKMARTRTRHVDPRW